MFEQLLAIIRNTFFESIRQPIMLVILVIATIFIILSNPLSAFTMSDDQRMFIDLGLATVFLCGTLMAAFIATNVLTREIDNFTALTVISKPVGRPLFVVGKYIGVAVALTIANAYMALVFMIVEQHSVLQTVRDPIHVPAIVFGVGALVIGVGVATWSNYFYNKVFSSTVICITTPLVALAYVMSMMFRHDFSFQGLAAGFEGQIWMGLLTLQMAILVLAAIAIAASTRLNQVLTIVITLGSFMLGMLSDWLFGARAEALRAIWLERARTEGLTSQEEHSLPPIQLTSGELTEQLPQIVDVPTVPLPSLAQGWELVQFWMYQIGYSILPNFQLLLLSDAINQHHVIPGDYVVRTLIYGVLYIVAALSLAVLLFQQREVG